MNKTVITYKNKKVYIGMDVHKKSYTLSAYCQGQVVKTATTPADPERITQSLKEWFPSALLYSVYEAGFSGYIRSLLVQAAWRAIEEDGVLRESFERIALRRGKKRAIVAIARKLIGRIRACFCKKTLYERNWEEEK